MIFSLRQALAVESLGLSKEVQERVFQFHHSLKVENQIQNLTRLASEQDFYEGHFLDVWNLWQLGWLSESQTALDLGSGCGVPGLLYALCSPEQPRWILCEAEKRKALFLSQQVHSFGYEKQVKVLPERLEIALNTQKMVFNVDTLVCRAVGTLETLAPWIFTRSECSLWNTLILFKGPRWEEEWSSFQNQQSFKLRKPLLSIEDIHEYSISGKTRKLIRLKRAFL